MSHTDPDCLFCKIVAGEVPGDVVASNDAAVAFRDVNPQAPTHVLVVPRRHVRSALEPDVLDEGLLSNVVALAQEVARLDGVDESGFRLVFNVGDHAGMAVPHLHLHVIGGRALSWPPG